MPRTRPLADVQAVAKLSGEGLTDRLVSERTGVPVATIRTWRRRGISEKVRHETDWLPRCATCGREPHDFSQLPSGPYAYLLGAYLGDGYLSRNGPSWLLRIALDAAYPGIVAECCDAVAAVSGRRPTARKDRRCECVYVQLTHTAWRCLLPQHGAGRKHERTIALTEWQSEITDREAGLFLRGLIHTDGWRGLNRVRVKGRDYAYPRYQFSNRSDDIRRLFTDACDRLGIEWRPWTPFHISVAKRDAVRLLDRYVGPKA